MPVKIHIVIYFFVHALMQATRPNAEELIKLEELLAGFEDAAKCFASDNAVLGSIARLCQESQRVPLLKLSDDSHC